MEEINNPENVSKEVEKKTSEIEVIEKLLKINKTQEFLSNPVRFNAEVYSALKIILDKLVSIEDKLSNKDGNKG